MAKGYWIGHVDVKNSDRYPDYMKAAQPAYDKYGAKFIVRGGRFEAVEGAARGRHVVVEFETYEQALACYRSPEYQAASLIRRRHADGDIMIVEGA